MTTLRAFGVRAFTALLYPHKPGMARSLNEWAADFAARTPGCLHTATFFPEPGAPPTSARARRRAPGCSRCHLQVGDLRPERPAARPGVGAARRGRRSGPDRTAAPARCPAVHRAGADRGRLLARHPTLRLVIAHLGMPGVRGEFLDAGRAPRRRPAGHDDGLHAFIDADAPFPPGSCPGCATSVDRVLLGTDFPNIPYPYPDALGALERAGLGPIGCARSAMTTPPRSSQVNRPGPGKR